MGARLDARKMGIWVGVFELGQRTPNLPRCLTPNFRSEIDIIRASGGEFNSWHVHTVTNVHLHPLVLDLIAPMPSDIHPKVLIVVLVVLAAGCMIPVCRLAAGCRIPA
ncbi:unnamed protein product [Prunus armeniaca]